MQLTCYLRLDFTPGPVPGQMHATVSYYTPEGTLLWREGPTAVAVGESITVGPVRVGAELGQVVGITPAAGHPALPAIAVRHVAAGPPA